MGSMKNLGTMLMGGSKRQSPKQGTAGLNLPPLIAPSVPKASTTPFKLKLPKIPAPSIPQAPGKPPVSVNHTNSFKIKSI